ncbi:class I SAM-dependent methyltransferase [Crenobacter cavernae]|uniref:Class I SAM-dependent methyltransferase n=1 Tax=Crenobacter cavernae TaxID=2290923 RepID=A0ABY0FE26_9NEIS|nr:class I SAM-dependent methyltransferase [Crenobacter cavernae]RXZ43459.1 class I SAM-dependent methyltransferase [Crenobacter cavernae]
MEQTKIWEHFQNDEAGAGDTFNSGPRYKFIAKHIPSGASALNIGVGAGGLERLLYEKKVKIYCLDPSEKSIENLRNKYDLDECAQSGFSQSMPFPDNTFDFVVMSEVLEHLTNEVIEATVAEVKRVLKPGGTFIATVPAEENIAASQVCCPHCGELFHRWGHVQVFDEGKIEQLLESKLSELVISRYYFSETRTLNWKGKIAWLAKQVFMRMNVKGSGETFFFQAKK